MEVLEQRTRYKLVLVKLMLVGVEAQDMLDHLALAALVVALVVVAPVPQPLGL